MLINQAGGKGSATTKQKNKEAGLGAQERRLCMADTLESNKCSSEFENL